MTDSLEATADVAAKTARPQNGAEYIESLRDGREVWIYGERVDDVTTHPAFSASVRSIARLYDGLHDGTVPTVPTDTGNGGYTHPFFRTPRSSEDLVTARDAIEKWARLTYGWMGRTPDYKAAFLSTLGVNDAFYAPYDANARRWYKESQEKALYWNHALINPPVDRGRPVDEVSDVFVHVEKETDNGLVLSGAKVVATGSATTQMTFIGHGGAPVQDKRFGIIAAVPTNAPGLKLIGRASYARTAHLTGSPFDYPLTSRFDENDAILVLDKVLVPWENVFLYGDLDKFNGFLRFSGFNARLTLQAATRMAVKLDFLSGLLLKSLALTGTKDFRGVQTRLGEVLALRSMVWSLTESMVRNPEPWVGGSVNPDPRAVDAYRWISTVAYPRVREVILKDLGSALIYLPSHARDFDNPELRPYLDRYVRGSGGVDAEERVKTLKMLWDAVGTEFGGRHELYELNYQGNHEQVRIGVLFNHEGRGWNRDLIDFAEQAMSEYDRSGWIHPDSAGPAV
ncbi:4-hydroxyphenylacetate 3-monooxygenase [Actinocorallia herbida]|uniref:4-hydroxyphenylacetate 3-monooxygenase n=1 Tax=Actinocorallia herbida TaxID=58109 RepID=A0A3N1CW98_9ACTN|nr:4-hydroxyphenylacetate 3-hydroxylase N-terminal domain-containing protein [Actinocorallia herbida]ROO85563.1 4-hydroxyphenylacetate 3-monooxygenase [Actinocorallia herbida]